MRSKHSKVTLVNNDTREFKIQKTWKQRLRCTIYNLTNEVMSSFTSRDTAKLTFWLI